MRTINNLVIHCTATPQNTTIASIKRYWKEVLKWINPGYHYMIDVKGIIYNIHPIDKPSNGVAGHNSDSIHISYIGGIDSKGNAKDTRTKEQKQALIYLLKKLLIQFPNAKIKGHRDFPGVTKMCPSFDVAEWLDCVGL